MKAKGTNLTRHQFTVTRKDREIANHQNAKCVLFTGLSSSGKSTISNSLEEFLIKSGFNVYALDGDNIRSGINNNLGFSAEERTENLRRIAEIAKLFVDAGIIVLCSFIAPSEEDREMIKTIVGEDDFLEVYVKASLKTCIERDPKGLYKKALAGEIKNFTGISAPYDIPKFPFHIVNTELDNITECIKKITAALISSITL
jgi:adenylylsulfate kinase